MKITLILLICLFVQVGTNFAQTNEELLSRAKTAIEKREYDAQVLQIDKKNIAAIQGRGFVYLNKKKDYNNAIADFNKLIELNYIRLFKVF